MFYQLPNGRVIEMSTEQYLEMSDEELEYLIAYNYGEMQENPWFGSILSKHDKSDILPELIDVPGIDKLLDLDVDSEMQDE